MLLGQYKKLEQNLLDGVNCRARTSLSTTTPQMRPVVTSGRKLTVNHTFSNMEALGYRTPRKTPVTFVVSSRVSIGGFPWCLLHMVSSKSVFWDVFQGDLHGVLRGDLHGVLRGDLHCVLRGDLHGVLRGDLHGVLRGDLHGALRVTSMVSYIMT